MNAKNMAVMVVLGTALAAASGCDHSVLPQRQESDRVRLGMHELPNEPEATQPSSAHVLTDSTPALPPGQELHGTYAFTVPPGLSTIKRTNDAFTQYQIYQGRPKPTDMPFVMIRVGPDEAVESQKSDGNFHVTAERTYMFNGMATHEWTGYTKDFGLPFVELVMKNPSAGSAAHALGVAHNAQTRETVLEILSSVRWQEAQ